MSSPKYATLLLCLIVVTLVSTVMSTTYERRCVDGETYYDGCNNCFCANGHKACTYKACVQLDPETQKYVSLPEIEAPETFWERQEEVKYPEP